MGTGEDRRQDEGADGVYMAQWIERQSSVPLGGGVAAEVGGVAVRDFVQDDGGEHQREAEKVMEKFRHGRDSSILRAVRGDPK